MPSKSNDPFLQAAIEEAKKGLAEGGIPIGSVLVIDGEIVGRGHNRRVQKGSAILHAEMDALENAGRLKASDYRRGILYSQLHTLALRHVFGGSTALPNSTDRHWRKPYVPWPRGLCQIKGRDSRNCR